MRIFLSNFKLWYPELMSIIDTYCTLLIFGNMLFNVGPLWMGLISNLLCLTGSRHNHTLPLAFETKIKLLHHYVILLTHTGPIICFCSWSSSSLSGSRSAYVTLLHGQLTSFTCNLNIPAKHQIPEKKTFLNLLCICCIVLLFAALLMLDLK